MFLPLHDTNALNHVRFQYVTFTLVVINVLIWVYFGTPLFASEEEVRHAYISYGYIPAVANHYETLPAQFIILPSEASYITYSFFHGDFMHLIGNMLFLWVFGDNVEDALGHVRFLIFYFACAAAGAFAHGLVDPSSAAPLIGASGAAAGVVAAYLLLHPKVKVWVLVFGRIPLRIPALWATGAWVAFQFYNFVFNSDSEVSWGAHIGGIVMGAILIVILRRSGVKLFDQDLEGKLYSADSPEFGESEDLPKTAEQTGPWGKTGMEKTQGDSKSKSPMPWGRSGGKGK